MLPLTIMSIFVLGMVLLTLVADIPTVSEDGSKLLGILQSIAGLVIPGLAIIALFVIAYKKDQNPVKAMLWTSGLAAVLMIGFTAATLALAPAPAESSEIVASTLIDQIVAGQDLYSIHCVECHGDDGKVTVIEGVEGLEGTEINAINSHDVLYTLNDGSLAEIINYGRPDAGMNPFGKSYNAEGLTKSEMDYIVTFMRYAWDDRYDMPEIKPLFPALADGEVPSYDVHIAPIAKRYCISCHRAGKENNNYLMTSYDEMLTTGDNVDKNIIAGDENSHLLQVIQGYAILDENGEELIGVMPPNSTLKPDVVDVWLRWIMNGMPQTAEEAAALFVAPTPTP
jgi:mono/diheme cytochrome c family protein